MKIPHIAATTMQGQRVIATLFKMSVMDMHPVDRSASGGKGASIKCANDPAMADFHIAYDVSIDVEANTVPLVLNRLAVYPVALAPRWDICKHIAVREAGVLQQSSVAHVNSKN
jgi:hypothetical protein